MQHSSFIKTIAVAALALVCFGSQLRADEAEDYARWYFSPSIGFYLLEGDQALEDGLIFDFRLGYDYNEWFSFEAGFLLAPTLDENLGGYTYQDEAGNWHRSDTRQSYSRGTRGFGDTWMASIYGDSIFHFTRWERLDPYLAGGVGVNLFGEDVLKEGGSSEFVIRGGAGFIYHFNDEWAFRGDWRLMITFDNTEFNSVADIGLVWYWGAAKEPDIVALEGPIDSDGDGLSDELEYQIGTDPRNPDTDGDGLTDGDEYLKYKTDPLNRDSDYDLLSDGDEVLKYGTNPLDPDTDKGGVRDGHEVLNDGTNPLDGNDDFLRFELNILFERDKAIIKTADYAELDTVASILKNHPGTTAVIEGHADQTTKSKRGYNQKLSERRAEAVKKYISDKGISTKRLKAVGYGFDRPQFKPDLVAGTPRNRRVEVYIRGVNDKDVSDTLKKMR